MNIIHIVSNKVWGGGERYALDLCRAQESDGHSVAVITRGYEEVDAPFRAAGFTPGHLVLGGAWDFITPIRLAGVLNRLEAPVVLHVHNFKDARMAVHARRLMVDPGKVRVVVTRHLVRPAKTGRADKALYDALDAIVFVSNTALEGFLESKPEVDAGKLHVVPNAVVAPSLQREEPEHPTILFCGRIAPEKGLSTLIDAFARLPLELDARLVVAGSGKGPDVMPLVKRARAEGLAHRIEWLGHVQNVWPHIASATIGVVPTIATEACGLSALEMMSVGVPVVASRKGGLAEIIEDGVDGHLFEAGNSGELARILEDLLTHPAELKRLGEAGAGKVAKTYAYPSFYHRIMDIYRS